MIRPSYFARGMRWALVVLSSLTPVVSAGICDCYERGKCSERCLRIEAGITCCDGDSTADGVPSCCSLQPHVVLNGCLGVGEESASDGCRCMLEPKEVWSGSKDHYDFPSIDVKQSLHCLIPSASDGLGDVLTASTPATAGDSGLFIPRRPVRILYGVWLD